MADVSLETINTSPLLGARLDLGEVLDAATAGGFRNVGLDTFSIEAWTANGRTLSELRDRLDSNETRCWSVAPLRLLDSHPDSVRGAHAIAHIVHALDAPWVVLNALVEPSTAVAATFRECSAIVSDAGAKLALEPVAWQPLNSIARALDYIDMVGTAAARVLLDPWHFFAARDSATDLRALSLDAIAYIQFDDALPPVSNDLREESVNRRAFPGEGYLDLTTWCADVRSLGFDGVVSAEILNDRWRDASADQTEFARRALDSITRFWGPPAPATVPGQKSATIASSEGPLS